MDGADIVDVLSRMERPQDTRIDVGTAMEIATRQGAEAVVTGDISSIGRGFVLSARLLAAADGAELVALRENARDDGEIIDAIDRLSKRLREEIGESMKTIRANKNLDFVSTGSLEALRYYSEAVTLTDVGEFERARDLLLQAIDLDSTFAMAYRKLAATYFNLGAPTHLQVEAVTKAYQLRDRLPERERWAATAYYYARVDRDNDREAAAYESLLEKYPDDMPALNNLALLYNFRGEFEKAVPLLRHALEVADRQSFYDNLLDALTGLKRWDEVDALLDQFETNQPNHPGRYYFRFLAAMAHGNIDRADTLLKSTSLNDSPNWQSVDETLRQRYYGMRGQFDRAEASARRGADINLRRGSPDLALVNYLDVAFNYLERENDPESARQILNEGLRAIPLDSIPPISRPYSLLVKLAAEVGDEDRARAWRAEYEELVPPQVQLSDVYRWEAAAAIAVLDNRQEDALSLLKNVREIDHCLVCRQFDEARLLEQMGETDAAIDAYTAFTQNTLGATLWFFGENRPVAYFRLGELYSLRGDTEEAIEAYSKFIDYWKDADASVQSQVAYARERVGELVEAQSREPGQ
jgi:tetratricopeptide (TPR) repeat protein